MPHVHPTRRALAALAALALAGGVLTAGGPSGHLDPAPPAGVLASGNAAWDAADDAGTPARAARREEEIPLDLPTTAGASADRAFGDLLGFAQAALALLVLLVGAPFAVVAARLVRAGAQRRAEAAAAAADQRAAALAALVALGDGLRALDLDVAMPDADASGRAEYARALECYEEANRALARADAARRLAPALSALEEGRRRIARARALLEPVAVPRR